MDFLEVTKSLAQGFAVTLMIFGITLAASLPLGLVITFGSMSKILPIRWITKVFVWIIRGTPLMLQVILIFYGPGLLNLDIRFERLPAVLIAFIINYACYFSEIYRGGIESIPKGQYEAGQVLGMTKRQIFFRIVLFQVIKRVVPPMGNEIITLVKDTSLARVIAVTELVKSAENIIAVKGIIWPLFYVGAFYLLFTALVTFLLHLAEKKMSYYSA
ncbi:MAG: amino acid ABC transporter permease [Oscillospiraceae bacterium]|nr:amino acid ABC transporter permease [Oscillospiraceae bacterium]